MDNAIVLLVEYLPLILAVLSEIGIFATFISKAKGTVDTVLKRTEEIKTSADFTAIKDKLNALLEENKLLLDEIEKLRNEINKLEE